MLKERDHSLSLTKLKQGNGLGLEILSLNRPSKAVRLHYLVYFLESTVSVRK